MDKKKDIVLEVKNIKKSIQGKPIIDGLSFEVYRGEIFGFLGANGAGKTTTIRMILGLAAMDEGEIKINGYSVDQEFESAIACVGGIIENPDMYGYLTGYENLLHYLKMYPNMSSKRLEEVIHTVGLDARINDKVKTYSLGMKQRLGLAQALLHQPSILILDEPTNGLDPSGIRELRDKLRELAHREQVAVLISSHLLSEMELMCDRVGVIQEGQLIRMDSLEHLLGKEDGSYRIQIEIGQEKEAYEFLSRTYPDKKVEITDGKICMNIAYEDIPSLIRELSGRKFDIYSVNRVKESLEDKYLEMIKSERS